MYDLVLGIDPGKFGAMAVLDFHTGQLVSRTVRQEILRDIYHWLYMLRDQRVFVGLEQAVGGSFDGKPRGAGAMFTYGREFGHLESMLVILRVPHTLIAPAVWTKELHRGTYAGSPKEKSLLAAQGLWPKDDFRATERSHKPHNGIVDAMLIAEYTRRELIKRTPNARE